MLDENRFLGTFRGHNTRTINVYVCLSVNTITQKIRNILMQNFAHRFSIAQGRVYSILVQYG